MVQRPTIHQFLAMVVDNINLEGQGRGSFKDLPHPFFLKSTLFTNSVSCVVFEKIDENRRLEIARLVIHATVYFGFL